jgi:hypothetical protein
MATLRPLVRESTSHGTYRYCRDDAITMTKPAGSIPLWVYLTTAALAVLLPMLTAPMYLFSADGAHYVGLARSLAENGSYVYNGRHEVMYPPGFPLLLLPAAVAFDGNFLAIVRWSAALSALVFPLTWVFARDQGLRHPGYIAALTVTATTFVKLSTGNPVSDLAYMACSLALLVWYERACGADAPPRVRGASMFIGALLLLLTVSIRTIGIAALVAVTAALALREWKIQRDTGAFSLRAFIPVIPAWMFLAGWGIWSGTMREAWYATEYMNSYLHQIALRDPYAPDLGRASIIELAMRPFSMIVTHAANAATQLTPIPWVKPNWFSPLVLGMLILVFAGCWRTKRMGGSVVLLYLFAYAGVILLWPFNEGERFVVPIVPVLWVMVARGVAAIQDMIVQRPRFARAALALVAVIASAGAAIKVFDAGKSSRQDLAALGAWLVALSLAAVFTAVPWARLFAALRRHGTPLLASATILFVALGLWQRIPPVLRRQSGEMEHATAVAMDKAASWLVANTSRDDIIQATFADALHFAIGRRTIGFPVTLNEATLVEVVNKYRPAYLVVLDQTPFVYFVPDDETRFSALSASADCPHVSGRTNPAIYSIELRSYGLLTGSQAD